jgi:ATP-dependent DNA helicase RecG
MPPKDRSATTSSPSSTSKRSPWGESAGDTPVQFVKGVGPRLGAVFNSRGIHTVKDLVTFFPRAYEDRTKIAKAANLVEGENATLSVEVTGSRKIPTRGGRSMLEVRTRDETGPLMLKWFHAPRGMESRFAPGSKIIVTGAIKFFMSRPEIIHPEVSFGLSASDAAEGASKDAGRVVPIYTEIEGVPSRTLRKILWEALEKYAPALTEDLPECLRQRHGLPRLGPAVRAIHFPEKDPQTEKANLQDLIDFNTPAHWRLVYEEFFKFEYLVLRQRLRMEKELAPVLGPGGGARAARDLEALLPFTLTGDQKKVLSEILSDLASGHPMNRLVQGDVGSGKTAVAFLAAACVLAEGGQVALMAPTEILAEQHFLNARKLFGGRLNVALLTGRSTQAERTTLLHRLASSEPLLLIGTHALIEEPVVFSELALVMIDEQHRFGVEQRRALKRKGVRIDERSGARVLPHGLILTATPIPRTLALTAYGELSVSSIQELPPGRTPVETHLIQGDGKALAFERIRDELKRGQQAYFIYPLVNESEAEGFAALKNAVAEADHLQHEVFPEFKVGLLHGQMRPEEKAAAMARFKSNELQILVSTTVVEVGVDVPNATIMVVEHAERFGLSQLHQLRGRVGRGARQSYCYLFTHPRVGETTAQRLEVLEDTNDGFKIAEADLEIRGPGEFLGTRQAGGLPFRLANLVRDREWLLRARADAESILATDPNLELLDHAPLRSYYEREGSIQFDRLKTS